MRTSHCHASLLIGLQRKESDSGSLPPLRVTRVGEGPVVRPTNDFEPTHRSSSTRLGGTEVRSLRRRSETPSTVARPRACTTAHVGERPVPFYTGRCFFQWRPRTQLSMRSRLATSARTVGRAGWGICAEEWPVRLRGLARRGRRGRTAPTAGVPKEFPVRRGRYGPCPQ